MKRLNFFDEMNGRTEHKKITSPMEDDQLNAQHENVHMKWWNYAIKA